MPPGTFTLLRAPRLLRFPAQHNRTPSLAVMRIRAQGTRVDSTLNFGVLRRFCGCSAGAFNYGQNGAKKMGAGHYPSVDSGAPSVF